MNDKAKKAQKQARKASVMESFKDIGSSTMKSLKQDLISPTSEDFFDQIFGSHTHKKYTGELNPGESIEMGEVFSGKAEENKKLRGQIALERRLSQEEKNLVEKKANQLKVQLDKL